ncbi:ankyrin repeat domain-containing protein [Endozoicomonas ascidiicola]|uniref:ankyrin repeat domain-containing protein n=1 Tax=Endozoicomonas ascidiicola TaxID=1698521 RepID=UPI000B1E9654|nr:ankyrin repeat domain-containing protein [Endozoicomonas ascidiicola]
MYTPDISCNSYLSRSLKKQNTPGDCSDSANLGADSSGRSAKSFASTCSSQVESPGDSHQEVLAPVDIKKRKVDVLSLEDIEKVVDLLSLEYVEKVDASGNNLLLRSIENGDESTAIEILKKFPELVLVRNDSDNYFPAHLAVKKGQTRILKEMLSMESNYVEKLCFYGGARDTDTPMHEAAKAGRIECMKLLFESDYESLYRMNIYFDTPVHLAAIDKKNTCLKFMLDKVKDNIKDLRLFWELRTGCSEGMGLIRDAHRKYSIGSTCSELSVTNKINEMSEFDLKKTATEIVSQLEIIEVFSEVCLGVTDTAKSINSFGDLNLELQVVKNLLHIGAKRIRLTYCINDLRGEEENFGFYTALHQAKPGAREVALEKIRKLLSISSGQMDVNQKDHEIKMPDGAILEIKEFSLNSNIDQSPLTFTFSMTPRMLMSEEHSFQKYFKSIVRINPFRFYTHTSLYSNFVGNRGDVLVFDEPENSIVPEQLFPRIPSVSNGGLNIVNPALWNTLSAKTADSLQFLFEKCQDKELNTSVVYGLNKIFLSDEKQVEVFKNWVRSLKIMHEKKPKPLLIMISSNVSPVGRIPIDEIIDEVNKTEDVKVVDLTSGCKDDFAQLISSNGILICKYPPMVKELFLKLIDLSSLPAIAEGANTTTYLLQTGHSYLSFAPEYTTPIPHELGDSLVAARIRAFSNKLGMTEQEKEVMNKLKGFLEQHQYNAAVNYYDKCWNKKILPSFMYTIHQNTNSKPTTVVVHHLITQIRGENYTPEVLEPLLNILDTSVEAMVKYIEETQDDGSVFSNHARKQQAAINRPSNNKVLRALAYYALTREGTGSA